ncbi:MAG: BON domain-containing protein, partial [Pseudomonadota bacterium]
MQIIQFIILSFLVSSCMAPTLMFTGVTGAGATLSKEQTVGSSIDDKTIWTKIKAAFLQHHKQIEGIMGDVSVEVSEGRVLLTGKTSTAESRLEILKLVWDQNGVREVINEIKLSSDKDSLKTYGKDSWITAQVRGKLLADKQVRSINYSVETINSTVYILGIARTEEERLQVILNAESVKNVEKIVDYIKVGTKSTTQEESKNSKEVIPDNSGIKSESSSKTVPAQETSAPSGNTSSNIDNEEHEIEI